MTDVPALERTHFTEFWEGRPSHEVEASFLLYKHRHMAYLGTCSFLHSDNYIYNSVFICPKCGQLWGRINYNALDPPDGWRQSYWAEGRPCTEHGSGSFVTTLRWIDFATLPRALLIHEILETHYAGKARPPSA